MTFIAVPIAVDGPHDVPVALARAVAAAEAGARLVEWRVDQLVAAPEAVVRLIADSPSPCIVTCRARAEGGDFDGDEATRAALFSALADAEAAPRYVDVELAAWSASAPLREAVGRVLEKGGGGLILSAHDFEGRPPDLFQQIETMTADPACAVVKVAWSARSLRDNMQAFDVLRERRKPTVALCMGPFGLLSRVLAPKFGGLLTFASDALGAGTAPGQPVIETLRGRYRFDAITASTRVYGVLGWPVAHSRSPDLHNVGFEAVAYDGVYLPLPVPPEYEHFKATVGTLVDHPALDFRGASVTIPHKTHLLRFVEERGGTVEDVARLAGAANTLVVGDGALRCTNTDVDAAIGALCAGMGIEPAELDGRRAAVLGGGGVARAVVAGLARVGVDVVVLNRSSDRAAALIAELEARLGADSTPSQVRAGDPEAADLGRFDVVVNATPVGMTGGPDPDGSPLPVGVPLDDAVTVLDTVYTPRCTPLLADAAARGARVVPGTEMFLRQAAAQFTRWTGAAAPIDRFRLAFVEEPEHPPERSSGKPEDT
jgi:3-dehydroquinate dehydratase/shikimate dehydrogenase